MNASSPQGPQIITAQMVRPWQDEHTRLRIELEETKAKIGPLQAKLSQMDALIKAAAPYSPELQEWLELEEERAMGAEGVALTDAIKKALTAHKGKPLARDTIKNLLPQYGYPAAKLQVNPNYFYTALKRLGTRQEITEEPPGQFQLK